MKALKALVSEKSSKMLDSEVPNLCSCGAVKENVVSAMKGGLTNDEDVIACASNC